MSLDVNLQGIVMFDIICIKKETYVLKQQKRAVWPQIKCVYAAAAAAKLPQSCPTLCDPIDGSPPDFLIPGILQARTLEWVASSFSKMCLYLPPIPTLYFLELIYFNSV